MIFLKAPSKGGDRLWPSPLQGWPTMVAPLAGGRPRLAPLQGQPTTAKAFWRGGVAAYKRRMCHPWPGRKGQLPMARL
ncbi:hypothetical protein BHE74_00046113 [Ensete ventricosum]|nr:hypothetical protein BHE74_00046113 [Ensete ventricosum]